VAKIGESGCTSSVLLLFIALAVSEPARADEPDRVEIPTKGQPTEDFYNAAGIGVTIIAKATPTDLTRNEWLTYSLTIVNLLNAPDVRKPSLKALAEFNSFQIDEGPELDAKADLTSRDRRVFIYRLRPHSESTALIPEVRFRYFNPKLEVPAEQEHLRFPAADSNAIPIQVRPPVEPPPAQLTPLDIPDFATQVATGPNILKPPVGNPPVWVWILALVVPPVLAVSWAIVWRTLYPDAAKLAMLKRNRAVRHALASVAASKTLPADRVADAISSAVLTYLRERFELPPGRFTPPEVADFLQSTGCPPDRARMVESLLRDCDHRRFAPTHAHSEMAVDAAQLIVALEEPA
jgi:hypothetical protein